MLKGSWMGLLIVSMLFSAAGLADDAKSPNAEDKALPMVAPSLKALPVTSEYAPRWQLSHPVETMVYSSDGSRPIANLDFQDSGAYARARKLRELSLLTLAEVGPTRLFLGVNRKGLVGIHFGALPRPGDERCLEFVRMPYLKNKQPDSEVE